MSRKQIIIFTILIGGTSGPISYFPEPILYVFGGSIFTDSTVVTGGALDEPSQHKYLFLLMLFGFPSVLLLTILRFFTDMENVPFRWAFRAVSAVLCAHTLSLLIAFSYHVWKYTLVMGVTVPRVLGVSISTALILLGIPFLLWLWNLPPPLRRPTVAK